MTERTFLGELKRRNVIKASAAYLALGWVVTQITATVAPMLNLPAWIGPVVLWIGIIGFPFVVMFSWIYEITPEGIKRESEVERDASITHITARRLDFAIVGLLVLAVVLFALDRFVVAPRREAARVVAASSEPATPVAAAKPPVEVVPSSGVPDIESDPSIAVLPLVNMSSDKEQDYFSDGISEELLNLLAKVPKLRVIARTSSFSFKGKDVPIPEIAQQLRVATVLEGSVRKAGDKVRITAQLIRASDGSHLWSETYDRTVDDIFKVQDEIAAAVVEQLKIKLLGAAPTAKPVDPKVYPLILQAEALSDRQTRESREQAAELFRQALVLAPDEVRAWTGLGRVYLNQSLFGERAAAEGIPLARQAANKALEIDPASVMALGTLSRIASDFELDLATGARFIQRALELDPGNLNILNSAGIMLFGMGRADESLPLMEYRVEHDPANPTAHNNLGNARDIAGLPDAAIDAWRNALRLSPDFVGTHTQIGYVLLAVRKDAAAALEEFESEAWEPMRLQGRALALHTLGRKEESDAALDALISKYGGDQGELIASVHAWRGDGDAAFEWLERALAAHDPGLAIALTDRLLGSLHADPRWLSFLRKIGYAPEQLAKIELQVTLPQ